MWRGGRRHISDALRRVLSSYCYSRFRNLTNVKFDHKEKHFSIDSY